MKTKCQFYAAGPSGLGMWVLATLPSVPQFVCAVVPMDGPVEVYYKQRMECPDYMAKQLGEALGIVKRMFTDKYDYVEKANDIAEFLTKYMECQ